MYIFHELMEGIKEDLAEIRRNNLIKDLMKMHFAPLHIAGLNTIAFRNQIKTQTKNLSNKELIDNFLQYAYKYFFETQKEDIKKRFASDDPFLYDCLNFQEKRNTFENFCDSYVDKTDELIIHCYEEIKREQEKQIFQGILDMPNSPQKEKYINTLYGSPKPANSVNINISW